MKVNNDRFPRSQEELHARQALILEMSDRCPCGGYMSELVEIWDQEKSYEIYVCETCGRERVIETRKIG